MVWSNHAREALREATARTVAQVKAAVDKLVIEAPRRRFGTSD